MSLLARRAPVLPVGALPRVDLLPPSEARRRDTLARARTWVFIGIAVLAASALLVAAAVAYNVAASVRLSLEQARTQTILAGIAELSDVSEALSTRTQLEQMRVDAMAGDIDWTAVLDIVTDELPPGVTVTAYSLTAGPVPDGVAAADDATGVSGSVTVQSPAAIDLVTATRDLRAAPGVIAADLESLTSAEGVYTYTVTLTLDQSVYSGDYTEEG